MKQIWLRLLALWFIVTSKNFILIHNIEETVLNGQPARKNRLLRRTDYSCESDFYSIKLALLANFNVTEIEEKQ